MQNDYKFKVNLGGMIDLLSNHLYSSPDVFVRELLQNCTDAISARLNADGEFNRSDAVIEIETEENNRIVFRDNGTGLDEEEIHRFLSVIGQSSKYDVESKLESGDYIGRFGIGLLSCFMVTDRITVRTSSYKTKGKTLLWTGFADGTYTIEESKDQIGTGTEIIIENNRKDKDESVNRYFSYDEISNLVYYYGLFLQYPVYMKRDDSRERLNLSIRLDPDKNKKSCMNFGKMFLGEDFIDCFPLVSDSGLFDGVAFVLPYPVSSAAHNMHRIYLKNMLLTEDGSELLPEWAFFIRCIINTKKLRPTSSREGFYDDKMLKAAREEISDCIAGYFEELDNTNPQLLYTIVATHSLAMKSVLSSSDGLDDVLLPYMIFETSLGNMNGKEIMEFGGSAYYTADINQFSQLAPIYTQRSELLINAGYVYEKQIIIKIAELSEKTDIEMLTDTDIDLMLDDSSIEYDRDTEKFIALANRILKKYDCKALIKSFRPYDIPTLYTINENASRSRQIKRSMEDADGIFADMLSSFGEELDKNSTACLYFNADNLIVEKLIGTQDEELLHCYIEILYVQSLLSGHFPLLHNEMKTLNENLYRIMELK